MFLYGKKKEYFMHILFDVENTPEIMFRNQPYINPHSLQIKCTNVNICQENKKYPNAYL